MMTFLLALAMTMNPEESKLIYVGDPMCSWCYGVSNEMLAVKDYFENDLPFEIVMGGLRPYNEQTMSDLKDFLSHHWEEVHQASGQAFNYDILDSNEITYDTEPPCRATIVVRKLKPEVAFAFFKEVQKAFYYENKNLHLKESYEPILKSLDIDVAEFAQLFESDEMKAATRADFQLAADMGVRGFPTLLLQQGTNFKVVANGYADSETMIARVKSLLSSKN